MCAAELARCDRPDLWGEQPFRIGLWVGTNVSPKRVDEAAAELKRVNEGRGHRLTVLQIQRCPWCGTPITPASVRIEDTLRRVQVFCGDDRAGCPFADGGAVDGGLPVLTVDEEIYRLVPDFVIATVDKFARLAREGEAASLFGYVSRRCDRHGYVHTDYRQCDIKDGSKHPSKGRHPAAAVHPATRLRPPDLIIQDELHLITGALGTTVGLFEVSIDALTTWHTPDGAVAKPLIVASSATVRNAADQVRGLYGRGVTVFPPQVIDAGETFFSTEVRPSADAPGRRYIGISTTGVRLTNAEIQVAQVLMAGAQELIDSDGDAADPYMTLVAISTPPESWRACPDTCRTISRLHCRKGGPDPRYPGASGRNTAPSTWMNSPPASQAPTSPARSTTWLRRSTPHSTRRSPANAAERHWPATKRCRTGRSTPMTSSSQPPCCRLASTSPGLA